MPGYTELWDGIHSAQPNKVVSADLALLPEAIIFWFNHLFSIVHTNIIGSEYAAWGQIDLLSCIALFGNVPLDTKTFA